MTPSTRRFFLVLGLVLAAVWLAPHLWADGPDPARPRVGAEINAHGLAAIMRARLSIVVLDARGSRQEFLPGAKPFAPNASASTLARLAPRKSALIVTYDNGASQALGRQLAERLARDGYQNVIRFPGGVEAWKQARYKLQRAAPVRPPPAPNPRRGSGTRR